MNPNENYELLISKFAHELRNPLTVVYSTLQLIENQCPNVKRVKYWGSLAGDIEYMIALLDDFSSLSSERIHMSNISLRTLMEQIVLSFAASLSDSQINFTSKIEVSDQTIMGDPVKLQEVFRNLLKNAAEACSPNDNIYLHMFSGESGTIKITIHDTGCGISEQQLPHIFDPFVTSKKQGSGLGLPICKQIIEAHHGSIEIHSTQGLGASVTVNLPAENQCE